MPLYTNINQLQRATLIAPSYLPSQMKQLEDTDRRGFTSLWQPSKKKRGNTVDNFFSGTRVQYDEQFWALNQFKEMPKIIYMVGGLIVEATADSHLSFR